MVRRTIPLGRRLRAIRGKIVLGMIWTAAAATCGVLLLLESGTASEGVAIANTHAVPVRAPSSGRLARLDVMPGQSVDAGAVLAIVESPGLSQQIAAAEADLRRLETDVGADEADRGRKFARDLEAARASWLSARVALERERAELTGVEQDLARAEAPGVLVATGEIERRTVRRDAAVAAVEARAAEVDVLERNYHEARERAGAMGSGALANALESASVRLEGLKMEADANVLRAPVAGVVSAPRPAQGRDGRTEVVAEFFPVPGEWVQAGVPVMTVTEGSAHDAVVFVDIQRARELAPGVALSVRSMAGRTFEAKVQSIGVSVEPVPLRQLRDQTQAEWGVPVTLEVLGDVLTPGESLSVDF